MEIIDCLLIGHAEPDLGKEIKIRELGFGKKSAAFQDMDQAFITYCGRPYNPLGMLNLINSDKLSSPFSNTDFLWPAVLVIGSFLHQHNLSFHHVSDGLKQDLIKEKLLNNHYHCIALTTTLYVTSTPVIDMVSFIRRYNKTSKIIIGGPFIKSNIDGVPKPIVNALLHQLGGDIYVDSGEGQKALVDIITRVKTGKNLNDVPNIIYHEKTRSNDHKSGTKKSEFTFNPKFSEYNDLTENRIKYSLFAEDFKDGFASIGTAKSCPYACSYCTYPQRSGKYSYLNVNQVEEELSQLEGIGVHTLTFYDDTFNVPKARFKDILRMMIRNRYSFKWNSFYRADQGDQETIELMAESGCEGVFIGMESASDSQLNNMAKTSRKVHYQEAIPRLMEQGILVHANYIIGFPGETEYSIRETIDFIREYKPALYKVQPWYCEKMSPIWKLKDLFGIEGEGFNWSHATMNSHEAANWRKRVQPRGRPWTMVLFLPAT
ncbi:MAG: radical SAM protein [Flavobacterium sp.]|nr:MAG: radical SAM protein [Flavobacterium sp.]